VALAASAAVVLDLEANSVHLAASAKWWIAIAESIEIKRAGHFFSRCPALSALLAS
jgi:hypothetical protein